MRSSCNNLKVPVGRCKCCIAAYHHQIPECLVKCRWSWGPGHFNFDGFRRYVCHFNEIQHECSYNTTQGYHLLFTKGAV